MVRISFKRTFSVGLLAVLVLVGMFGSAQRRSSQLDTSKDSRAFRVDEEIKIVVSYSWFFVWTDVVDVWLKLSAETKNGKDAIRINGFGKSRPFYDWFYQVRDTYETWLDPASLRPIFFNREVDEDGYLIKNFYTYDWSNKRILARIQKKKDPARMDTIAITSHTNDVISLIYNIRNIDFTKIQPNERFPIELAIDDKVQTLSFKFDKVETIRVKGMGKFRCIKLSAKMVKGRAFTGKENMFIWLTADNNRLPIYMESPIKVGTIKARITEMKNLKYPLSSKVSD
jgi:Protein of unknown function (DUF3108).